MQDNQHAPEAGTSRKYGEAGFNLFCAVIFLGMIGLVCFNAVLRYFFRASFPPTEEWARFLFLYITFFGAIEAFYRKKNIAVELAVEKLKGAPRKAVEAVAILLTISALALIGYGGVQLVLQTMDTYSVATNINMTWINGIVPVMAAASILVCLRDLVALLRGVDQVAPPSTMPME
jgi:TRAP-type C4-dicarboxylate transport system permease small subunit